MDKYSFGDDQLSELSSFFAGPGAGGVPLEATEVSQPFENGATDLVSLLTNQSVAAVGGANQVCGSEFILDSSMNFDFSGRSTHAETSALDTNSMLDGNLDRPHPVASGYTDGAHSSEFHSQAGGINLDTLLSNGVDTGHYSTAVPHDNLSSIMLTSSSGNLISSDGDHSNGPLLAAADLPMNATQFPTPSPSPNVAPPVWPGVAVSDSGKSRPLQATLGTSNVTMKQLSRSSGGGPPTLAHASVNSKGQITLLINQSQRPPPLPHPASGHPSSSGVLSSAAPARGSLASSVSPLAASSGPPVADEESDEEEEYTEANTYANYAPKKLSIGKPHPDAIVESSSLSSVIPPDVWYEVQLPTEVIQGRLLSSLQLEAVTYASQQHWSMLQGDVRSGFLIGDGAGVGKGRTIAGIIYENYLQGRKRAVWLSVSSDLIVDAKRDLSDIGASRIPVNHLTKLKYKKPSAASTPKEMKKGVIFGTYSALIGETMGTDHQRRLDRLVDWCKGDDNKEFDGLLVFDECHKAKNLMPRNSSKPSKTGQCVLEIQKLLPKARVVYCSATGASEPRHMAYMTRLGLWGTGTPFSAFNDFLTAIEKRGVGGMEVVAMDMKLRGMYVARQLSFQGSTFQVVEVPLTPEFKRMYDDSVKLWVKARGSFQKASQLMSLTKVQIKTMWAQFWSAHQRFFKYLCIAAKVGHVVSIAKEAINNNKCVVIGLQSTGEARTLEQIDGKNSSELDDFISTAKGVVQSLIEKHFPTPSKNDDVFEKAGKSKKRKAPSSGSQSSYLDDTPAEGSTESTTSSDDVSQTSEIDDWDFDALMSRPKRKKTDSGEDHASTSAALAAAGIASSVSWQFENVLRDSVQRKTNGSSASSTGSMSSRHAYSRKSLPVGADGNPDVLGMKQELEDDLEELGPRLPFNTLDELIQQLGGSSVVAEMTGRRGRVVGMKDGRISYEPRAELSVPLDQINISEKDRFMSGEKLVAIISEAASSGISMQADRRVKNQRRRVHITLELPWSADRAIQQFGRTHRSNQTSAPEYLFLISELSGERRFASVVAKRLESLGALTHGDRRASESRDLSRYNYDTKYGRTALENVLRSVMNTTKAEVPVPTPTFFEDVGNALVGVGLLQESKKMLVDSKDLGNLSRFLNRILGVPVDLQNMLFAYFADMLAAVISAARKTGRYDDGILDLQHKEAVVKVVDTQTFHGSTASGQVFTELHTVKLERGMTWDDACKVFEKLNNPADGFYLAKYSSNGKQRVQLVVVRDGEGTNTKCCLYQPHLGRLPRVDKLTSVLDKYIQADDMSVVEKCWREHYEQSAEGCKHSFFSGRCRRRIAGADCDIGRRQRTIHILSGSVLSVWSTLERTLQYKASSSQQKLRIMRVKTDDGNTIIGTIIPKNCLTALRDNLQQIDDEQQNTV